MPEEFEDETRPGPAGQEPFEDDDDDLDEELSHDEAEERYLAILTAATEITSAAVSNAGAQALKDPDQVAAFFTKIFDTIVNL
jgi:hypothetical protein